jgi:hypothetical protein
MNATQEAARTKAPKNYSKDLIELIFEQPYCKIRMPRIWKPIYQTWQNGCIGWRTYHNLSGANTFQSRAAPNNAPWGYHALKTN